MWSSTTNTTASPVRTTTTYTTTTNGTTYTYAGGYTAASGYNLSLAEVEQRYKKLAEEREEEFTKKFLQIQQEKDELEYKVQELEEKLDEERSKNNR